MDPDSPEEIAINDAQFQHEADMACVTLIAEIATGRWSWFQMQMTISAIRNIRRHSEDMLKERRHLRGEPNVYGQVKEQSTIVGAIQRAAAAEKIGG